MTARTEPFTLELVMTQELIDRWAGLSGDFNRLHVDPDFAAQTSFGTTIAHGHITLAILTDSLVAMLGTRWFEGGALHDVRFKAPIRPGDLCVLTIKPIDSAEWELSVNNVASAVICLTGRAKLSPVTRA